MVSRLFIYSLILKSSRALSLNWSDKAVASLQVHICAQNHLRQSQGHQAMPVRHTHTHSTYAAGSETIMTLRNRNIFLLEGCSMIMSIMVKSREWTNFSTSAMLVMSRTQATTGQVSIADPKYFHALFCWTGEDNVEHCRRDRQNTP